MLAGSLLTALFWVLAVVAAALAVRVRKQSQLVSVTLCCLAISSSLSAVSRAVRARHEHLFILADRLNAGATAALILAGAASLLLVLQSSNRAKV